jgi:hypothetical protein
LRRSGKAADGDTINVEGDNMNRPTETRSGRWEAKSDPAKWKCKSTNEWRSQREGDVDLKKIGPWVEDMEEWSEMMYEALMELRGEQAALRQEFHELSDLVASGKLPGGDK